MLLLLRSYHIHIGSGRTGLQAIFLFKLAMAAMLGFTLRVREAAATLAVLHDRLELFLLVGVTCVVLWRVEDLLRGLDLPLRLRERLSWLL